MNLSVLTAGHTRMIHYILSFQRAAFTVANLTSTGVIAPRLVYLLHFCLRLKEFVAANSLSHNNAYMKCNVHSLRAPPCQHNVNAKNAECGIIKRAGS